MNSVLMSLIIAAFAITSSMAQKFQYSYDLKGVSGYKERFSPDMSDDTELKRVVLFGKVDSIKTMVRRLTSSYNGLQYLVIDNYIVENGAIRNEVNLQSIYAPKEIQRSDDWKLVGRFRLSNDNLLVVVSLASPANISVSYVHRFLIYDRTGKSLLSLTDYFLPEKPKTLIGMNGGFSIVIQKDYTPLAVNNIALDNGSMATYAEKFGRSKPAISYVRFSSSGKFIDKNAYLLHNDANIQSDVVMDVGQESKFDYVLLKSYIAGVINQPTLAALLINRDNPSKHEIQILYEGNAIMGIDNSVLKKEGGVFYSFNALSGLKIRINNSNDGVQAVETEPKEPADVKVLTSPFPEAKKILSENGIAAECYTYTKTGFGNFIGVRTEDNTPFNYLYVNGELTLVSALKSMIIFGYNAKQKSLIVGYYDRRFKNADTMARTFYTYNLGSREFKQIVKYDVEVYNVSVGSNGDSLICHPNIKNPDGIGSNMKRRATKINY